MTSKTNSVFNRGMNAARRAKTLLSRPRPLPAWSDLGPLFGLHATPGDPLSDIAAANQVALAEVEKHALWNLDAKEGVQKQDQLKHQYPFIGLVNCETAGQKFHLWHMNDDVVAWYFFWRKSFEHRVFETLSALSVNARHFLDVGAYTGCYSLFAARCGLEVDAFELVPRTVERLKMNVIINGLQDKIRMHNFGVSNRSDLIDIHMPRPEDFLGTGNSVDEKARVKTMSRTPCRVRPLDEWWEESGKPQIDIIKIDVEEHEFEALSGARGLIGSCRPSMIVEIDQKKREPIEKLCADIRYSIDNLQGINFLMTPD
ncbi:MAG: FkbM family methyltransferase [Pseudomonadota bacterium]